MLTFETASTLGDIKLAKKAVIITGYGIIAGFLVSFVVGLVVPFDYGTSFEIKSRTEVHHMDIILALAAGSAGALAFTTGLSASLVGVMVAVALLPPLVVAGLFLGNGELLLSFKAFLLLVTNIICINISGIITFLFQGIRPRFWWEEKRANKMVRVSMIAWLSLLIILVALIFISS